MARGYKAKNATSISIKLKLFLLVFIIVGIVILMAIPIIPVTYETLEPRQRTETYWEKEPYQVTREQSVVLVNEKVTVPARDLKYFYVYIDVSNKQENVVYGSVIETAGYDINFYVFDQKKFLCLVVWSTGCSICKCSKSKVLYV